jgi:eukaryotic-like serine/threonine-protein kinase
MSLPALEEDRYEDRGLLGEGAMGEVRRVLDRRLGCELACKVLWPRLVARAAVRDRFETEARVTARLRHPGVVPVHDFGRLHDGRPWFTMAVVEGRTLRELVTAVHAASPPGGWGRTEDDWDLPGLVEVLAQVADVLAYAHQQAVVHRDVKPSNVMIGAFREVRLMDWGIARSPDLDLLGDPEAFLGAPSRHRTQLGRAIGTPSYMAPEQARGDLAAVGPWSDVYALGALIYKVLSGRSPFRGDPKEILARVRSGPPVPVRERTRRPLPAALVRLCEEAMHRDPGRRPPGARAVAEGLRAWLDGHRRRAQADAFLADVATLERALGRARAREVDLEGRLDRLRREIQPWEPPTTKRELWDLEDRAEAAAREARQLERRVIQGLRAVLSGVPDHPEARERLAGILRERAERALDREDEPAFVAAVSQLRTVDTGTHAAWLAGRGWLSLDTQPAGARVVAIRQVSQGGLIEEGRPQVLGTTPLRAVSLEAGSWVLELSHPGCETIRYPIVVERETHVAPTPPGASRPIPVLLPSRGTVDPDQAVVAAGWCRIGGTYGPQPLPPRRIWIDGFVIQRTHVTVEDWLIFARALHARAEDPTVWLLAGLVELGPEGPRLVDGVEPRAPASRLHPRAARSYARWLGTRDGHAWRLPHELEWEKACRGADGRSFPWGERADPCLAAVLGSGWDAGPSPVGTLETDRSIYGVRDLVGNVRDLCVNAWDPHGPPDGSRLEVRPAKRGARYLATRGGRWRSSITLSAASSRLAARPDAPSRTSGFRLVRPLEPPR